MPGSFRGQATCRLKAPLHPQLRPVSFRRRCLKSAKAASDQRSLPFLKVNPRKTHGSIFATWLFFSLTGSLSRRSSHAGHQDVVIDVVEEFRQVQIDRDAVAGLKVGLYLLECALGAAFWSEAVTRFREARVEYRRHDLGDGLLDDPINHVRDAQRTLAPVRLRNADPSYRLGLIAAIVEALANRRPLLAGIGRQVFSAQAVDARCAAVGLHSAPCLVQVGRRQYCLHQVLVQGWLRSPTPILGSPGRVRRRGRVGHGSALSLPVRPFGAPRAGGLLRPLLSSVRSRREFLPVALCRFAVCRLFARLRRATRRSAWALMIQFRPFWTYGSACIATPDRSPQVRTRCFRAQALHLPCPPYPMGFVMRCQLARRPGLLCSFCPSPRTFALGLPPDKSSRPCPCLRLVVIIDSS